MDHRLLAQPDRDPARSIALPPADQLLALFAQALDRQQAGHAGEAAALYERILALNADIPEIHNNLGAALASLGRFVEAESAYQHAVAIRSDYAEACFNLANTLAALRRFDEAEPMYRRAISLMPDFAGAYSNLGHTLKELGKLDEAEAAYRAAIALDPNRSDPHVNLGNVLKGLGRLGDAEPILRRAIALNPSNAEAYSSLGTVLQDLSRDEEAEAMLRHAIALRPDFAGAYNNLGLTLKQTGRLDEAREAAERAIQLAPRRLSYYTNLADVRRFARGDSVVTALEAMAEDPASLAVENRIHLHFALAKAYDDIGERDNAFRQWLAGNALKRRHVVYDEAAMLGGMERVRQVFAPELFRSLEGWGEPSRVPVFVVGMPRSGTTLIEQILASHPAVHGAGELKLFDRAAAKIRSLLPRSPGYPEMMSSMQGEHVRRAVQRSL